MRFRPLFLSVLSSLMIVGAVAEHACQVPVDIVGIEKGKDSGGIIRGLKAEDLAATVSKGHNVPIHALTYDATARRIVFVIDNARALPSDARKLEAQTAAYIVEHARPMDSFALITARGTLREVKFEQGRDAVKEALRDLSGDPKEKTSSLGPLDAVEQGIEWLGVPKDGDSILLMAMDLDGNHKANRKKIAQELEEHQIRLFGIAFGFVNLANSVKSRLTTTHLGMGIAEPLVGQQLINTGDENFYPLVADSGGFLSIQNAMDERRTFTVAERLPMLQQTGMQLYQIMAEFYHMTVSLPDAHTAYWEIELSDSAKQHWTPVSSIYPQVVNCK
ncbi:MAG TPA: hypothetical protein VN176_07405 [Verrucomicrobiae bacterium]|jgi:hypothetical protein|nr:hypothetical protein [Verrucomicrobiae bacterium]